MSLKLPEGWRVIKTAYVGNGIFARCYSAYREIFLTIPWWVRPFKWFVLQHELGHAWGIEHDHQAPPWCIMYGDPAGSGWHEKGLGIWLRIAWAAWRRKDWFCPQCRAILDKSK